MFCKLKGRFLQEKINAKGSQHEVQLEWKEIHRNRRGLDSLQGKKHYKTLQFTLSKVKRITIYTFLYQKELQKIAVYTFQGKTNYTKLQIKLSKVKNNYKK